MFQVPNLPTQANTKPPTYKWSQEVYNNAVKLGLQLGVDINAVDSHDFFQQPALCHAIAFDNVLAAKALIEEGGNDIDLNRTSIKPIWATTPLLLAIQRGHHEIIEMLLKDERTDVNKPDTHGLTPLHWAAIMLDDRTIDLLLKRDANPLLASQQQKIPADYLYPNFNNEDYLKQIGSNLKVPVIETAIGSVGLVNSTTAPEYRPVIAHMWNDTDGFINYLDKKITSESRHSCMQLMQPFMNPEKSAVQVQKCNLDYDALKTLIVVSALKRLQNTLHSDKSISNALSYLEGKASSQYIPFLNPEIGHIVKEAVKQLEQIQEQEKTQAKANNKQPTANDASVPSNEFKKLQL